ncbi:MAG: hypothetical protein FD187_3221, partial [bacterium]
SVSGEREGLKALTYVVFLPIRLYGADAGDKAVGPSCAGFPPSGTVRLRRSGPKLAEAPASSAVEVTLPMFFDTSVVPMVACSILRAISLVAAPCSSTADAIKKETSLISVMVPPMP